MSTETDPNESAANEADPAVTDDTSQASSGPDAASDDSTDKSQDDVQVNSLDYQQVAASQTGAKPAADLNRFQDIKVTVSADLGRAKVPLQTLLNLGEGSILELDRQIDSPVELVAQGVPLASGEVVVVNGCFAIRVTKVYESKAG